MIEKNMKIINIILCVCILLIQMFVSERNVMLNIFPTVYICLIFTLGLKSSHKPVANNTELADLKTKVEELSNRVAFE